MELLGLKMWITSKYAGPRFKEKKKEGKNGENIAVT